MSDCGVVELSSDSEHSPLSQSPIKSGKFSIDYPFSKDEPAHPLYCDAHSDRSSSLDEYFMSDSENKDVASDKLDINSKHHDISSSDDDFISPPLCDEDSGLDCCKRESLGSQSSSYSASQASTFSSTQDGTTTKESRAAETQRKRIEKELHKASKQREKEEKKKQREEKILSKLAEKQKKKEAAFRRNQMKPNECLKYMTVLVDEKLFKTVLCSKAIEIYPHPSVNFNYQTQPVDNAVTWTRTQLDGTATHEDWVAIMWPAEDVVKAVQNSTLVSTFQHISTNTYPGKHILLLIFAMELYHRKSQNASNYKARMEAQHNSEESCATQPISITYLTREEVELALVELQILAGVCHRHFEDSSGFADILAQFTRAIAEIPYKREKEEIDREMGWYARSSNKNCVRANKDMQGLHRLWIQHLTVFNNTNVDTAKAIVALYPTPSSLIEAYENCSTQAEKEKLLQNIQIKRSGSTSAVIRRIGPELSKKICWTFTQNDGDLKLGTKK